MKTTHREIEIEYAEKENRWVFTLRGRERKVESLAKAKEAIDRPVKEDKPEFKRRTAWFKQYGRAPLKCEVTSIAEGHSWSSDTYFWIVVPSEGRRRKESITSLLADTPQNAERIEKVLALDKRGEELEEEKRKINNCMTPFNL